MGQIFRIPAYGAWLDGVSRQSSQAERDKHRAKGPCGRDAPRRRILAYRRKARASRKENRLDLSIGLGTEDADKGSHKKGKPKINKEEKKKMMKKRMTMVLALAMTVAVLGVGSVAMAGCQAEEATTTEEEGTTNQEGDGTTAEPEALSTLVAWGDNLRGALGNGTNTDSSTPVEVSNLTSVQQFAAGSGYSLALKDDGTVWAWGMNQYGELGNGTIGVDNSSSTPVEVKDPNDPSGYLSGVKAIAAGSSHGLALKDDGSVWAWGSNRAGQLGNGTYTDSSTLGINTPVQVSELGGVKAIAAGLGHSLALKEDGTVWAWGSNTGGQGTTVAMGEITGQLGDDTITSSNTPVEVGSLGGGVEAISAGGSHSLALKNDGTVWAWGWNYSGQLGNGTNTDSSTPVQVSELGGVKAISAGGGNLALKDDGTVWAWGSNQSGQLGNGSSTSANETMCEHTGQTGMLRSSCPDSNTPVEVSGLSGVKAIAAGSASLALKDDGTVWAWGANGSGQLGNGTRTVSPTLGINTPAQVSELSGVKAIAAGGSHNLAGW